MSKAIPDPVEALLIGLEECRRLTHEEVQDVRDSLSRRHAVVAIAARLRIPAYVVKQIESARYFTIV